MTQSFWLPFLILPTIGGVLGGAIGVDWRLAAAALAGSLGLLFLPIGAVGPGVLVLPVAGGIAVGAAIALLIAFWRRDVSLWTRMSAGMMGAFLLHLGHMARIGLI